MIEIPAHDDVERAVWETLVDLHRRQPEGWTLIGAQMVALHDLRLLGSPCPDLPLRHVDVPVPKRRWAEHRPPHLSASPSSLLIVPPSTASCCSAGTSSASIAAR